MEASTVDTANKRLTLLGVYKRDLAEAQRTVEALAAENASLYAELQGQRCEARGLRENNEALTRERAEILKRCDAYLHLAVILGVIAAIETIALLVRWGVR